MLWCREQGFVCPILVQLLGNRLVTHSFLFVLLDTASKVVVTQSKPSDFPSLLRQKLSIVKTIERHKIQTEALANETCEKCGRTEVRFSAVQLRGADEGSTIFYTCECGNKYVDHPRIASLQLRLGH